MNAFSAGSNADISEKNLEMEAAAMLNKQQSKPNLAKNLIPMASESQDIYGNSTAAGTSKPQINFTRGETSSSNFAGDSLMRESGIQGSIKNTSSKLNQPLLLN